MNSLFDSNKHLIDGTLTADSSRWRVNRAKLKSRENPVKEQQALLLLFPFFFVSSMQCVILMCIIFFMCYIIMSQLLLNC